MANKSTTSEKTLEKRLSSEAKRLGGWAIKLPAYLVRGLPDRLILMPHGRAYFAEIKTTGEGLTPVQKLIRSRIEALGFTVYAIDSDEALSLTIKSITQN